MEQALADRSAGQPRAGQQLGDGGTSRKSLAYLPLEEGVVYGLRRIETPDAGANARVRAPCRLGQYLSGVLSRITRRGHDLDGVAGTRLSDQPLDGAVK